MKKIITLGITVLALHTSFAAPLNNDGPINAQGTNGQLTSTRALTVGTSASIATTLAVGTSANIGTNLTVGNSASTWLLVKSGLYVRDASNVDLFVVSSTGDITMKKAQGDIGMGQFGN